MTNPRDPFTTHQMPGHGSPPPAFGGPLATIIETEIIPRLMIAHLDQSTPAALGPMVDGPGFAEFALGNETAEIVDRLRDLVDLGIEQRRIYLDLIAPCARRMRELWESGRCSFAEVTRGLMRLERALRAVDSGDDPDQLML